MRRNAALAGLLLGALAAIALRRRFPFEPSAAPQADPRAEELRRKLAEARESAADEDDFEAAGMASETMLEDEPRPDPGTGDVDETRRRVHEQARAAAEEMRGGSRPEDG